MSLTSKIDDDLSASGLDLPSLSKFVKPLQPKDIATVFKSSPAFAENVAVSGPPIGGLAFQYHDIDEDGDITPAKYHRYKIYWPPLSGFAAKTKDRRPKYLQPPDTPVKLYIPPTIDWKEFMRNPSISLAIVEGEKKALALAARGVACVAVGGVYNTGNRKRGEAVLPELRLLSKGSRTVYVVFDVDEGNTTMKPEVARAANILAERLLDFGAIPRIVTLPSDGSRKMAIDDWLLENSEYNLVQILQTFDTNAHSRDSAVLLYSEAEKYVYIGGTELVGQISNRELIARRGYLTDRCNVEVIVDETKLIRDKSSGMLMPHRVSVVRDLGEAFLRWPARPSATSIRYEPGVLEAITPDGAFNTWKGWAQPVPESVTEMDVEPLRKAFKFMYKEDWHAMWEWFMLPIAKPGIQQVIMPIIQSPKTGTGKSSIPVFFCNFVYGTGEDSPDNATILNSTSVKNQRMEFILNKQFVLIDDANDADRATQDMIKGLVTSGAQFIDAKYVKGANKRTRCCWCVTTNRELPFKIDDPNDRRLFLPATSEEQGPHIGKFWQELHDWGRAGGGGKVVAYAQQLFDAEKVDPMRSAPMTPKKAEMVNLGRSFSENVILDLITQAKEGKLNRVLTTVKELREMLVSRQIIRDVSEIHGAVISSLLKVEGAERYKHGSSTQTYIGDSREVVYILAQHMKWRNASPTDIKNEFVKKPVIKGPYDSKATGTKY